MFRRHPSCWRTSSPNIWNFHLYILTFQIFFLHSSISDIFLQLRIFRFATVIYSTRNIFWRERLGSYHFHSLFKHMETNGFKNKIIAFHRNIRLSKNRSISFPLQTLFYLKIVSHKTRGSFLGYKGLFPYTWGEFKLRIFRQSGWCYYLHNIPGRKSETHENKAKMFCNIVLWKLCNFSCGGPLDYGKNFKTCFFLLSLVCIGIDDGIIVQSGDKRKEVSVYLYGASFWDSEILILIV